MQIYLSNMYDLININSTEKKRVSKIKTYVVLDIWMLFQINLYNIQFVWALCGRYYACLYLNVSAYELIASNDQLGVCSVHTIVNICTIEFGMSINRHLINMIIRSDFNSHCSAASVCRWSEGLEGRLTSRNRFSIMLY